MPKVTLKKETTVPKKAEEDKKAAAQVAVEQFEAARAEYHEAASAWSEDFPDADAALDQVKKLEDRASELCAAAKPLVAASGEKEIGDFKVQYPMSTPTYDGKRLLKLLLKLKSDDTKSKAERFDLLVDLYERGLLVELNVDTKVAGIVHSLPQMKPFETAWAPSEKLTPRVSVPKV